MFLFKKRIHCTYISTFFAKLSYNLPPKGIKKSWLMCSRLCLLTQIADIVRATTTTSTTASASSISICWIHAIRVSTSLKLNISDWLSETTEGWNTPKYSLNRWLSLKVHHWARILRFLTNIWFLQTSKKSKTSTMSKTSTNTKSKTKTNTIAKSKTTTKWCSTKGWHPFFQRQWQTQTETQSERQTQRLGRRLTDRHKVKHKHKVNVCLSWLDGS